MGKKFKLEFMLVGLMILGAVFGIGLPVAGASPWSGTASYSLRNNGQFQVGYQVNDVLGFDLAYRDLGIQALKGNRWQGRLLLSPVETVGLQAGYDLTGKHYFVGGQADLPLNQNLRLITGLNTIIPTDGGNKYLDYRLGLEIGIGYSHYLFAGAQGEYELGTDHEPELFVEMDLNWRLPKNFGIRVQPHIGVEGDFSHQTTVFKQWANKLETGVSFGQDAHGRWDVGLVARY